MPVMERHCDVCVIGGSAAGLAAALQIGRQRRSVIVVDDQTPRNAPAAHMHSFLGREGQPPAELLAAGREEVRSYGGEVLASRAVDVTRDGALFRVRTTGGHSVLARRVVVATGVADELPAVEGLDAHWGREVISCVFCHGYEVRDRRVVILVEHPASLHAAGMFRQLTDRLTVVAQDPVDDPDDALGTLRAGGVDVLRGSARRVVDDADGRMLAVELGDGTQVGADAVVVAPRVHARVDAVAGLGLHPAPHPSGLGEVLEADDTGATAVPGVYAAGNVVDPMQQVAQAAAHGSRVGAMVSGDLAREDLQAAARVSANQSDWDHRYGGERVWSGNPNGTLVREATSLTPGRALDVGAGEGGDAVWLAQHGWRVTASDVSVRALATIAAEAQRQGLDVTTLHADANGLDPFPPGEFDLVSASYASIPRTPDDRGVRNLLAAVAPGGTLLVLGHELAPMAAAVDPGVETRPFDADAYVRVGDVAAVLEREPGWTVEVHETRPRPAGAVSHHAADVVLRARRDGGGLG